MLQKNYATNSKEYSSETKNNTYSAIAFECVFGTWKSRLSTAKHFQMLAIFSKYYNEQFCIKEDRIGLRPKYIQ